MKTPRRERNSFFSALWRQRGRSGGRGDQGPKKKEGQMIGQRNRLKFNENYHYLLQNTCHFTCKEYIRKSSWLYKGHFAMISGPFLGHFRVILGSFPDQTPNRAVTAKVTFMVTKWYSFENYLWFFQNRFKKINLWFSKIIYGFGDHVKNYLLVIIEDYHWYLQ